MHPYKCRNLLALPGESLCGVTLVPTTDNNTYSGRPSSSHYFVGVQGLYLFYLDPHYTRPALPFYLDPDDYSQEEMDTCHNRKLRRLHIREMDPSMLIGFLIRDERDWADWRRSVKHVQGKAIIFVSDHDPVAHGSESGGAIDHVETLSDDDDDGDGIVSSR